MKIDVNKPLTLGARRTLKAFRTAMFDALGETEFDKITVNQICEKSEYPRATFYNYFDDKLDLLKYLWSYTGKSILNQLPEIQYNEDGLIQTFNLLLKFFKDNQQLLNSMRKSNGSDSHLWHNISSYLRLEATNIIYEHYRDEKATAVPSKLLARFDSDLILGLLEWCLFEEPTTDTDTADEYLINLLHGKA